MVVGVLMVEGEGAGPHLGDKLAHPIVAERGHAAVTLRPGRQAAARLIGVVVIISAAPAGGGVPDVRRLARPVVQEDMQATNLDNTLEQFHGKWSVSNHNQKAMFRQAIRHTPTLYATVRTELRGRLITGTMKQRSIDKPVMIHKKK